MKNYWFRPKKFWKIFAAYYPASWQGWLVSLIAAGILVCLFVFADQRSHSVSDTLISFTPGAVAVLLAVDLICFRTGEYPSW